MEKQQADAIITGYLQKIYGFAIRKTFSYAEAQELCAAILLECYRALRGAPEVRQPERYIWRLCMHVYARHVQAEKQRRCLSLEGMQLPVYDDIPDEAQVLRLREAVAFLTEKRREAVYRFYYLGQPVAQIARETGAAPGTVKWHLNRARHELKEAFWMEKRIGRLGLHPVEAAGGFGHGGCTGQNFGPETYLGDRLSLNIVYSTYWQPRTREEIAEELGVTPVYIEDRLALLEDNGFLVRQKGERFTTYVHFTPERYSREWNERLFERQLAAARRLIQEYVPLVRQAMAGVREVYIPGGSRALFEAAVVFYAIENCCRLSVKRDVSRYLIKTTAGGSFIAHVFLGASPADPDYPLSFDPADYRWCGSMIRDSQKYPALFCWSTDTRYCSRAGGWQENRGEDYEYLYEYISGMLPDTPANAEKHARLHARGLLDAEGRVNVMVVRERAQDFFARIPELSEAVKSAFAGEALELAMELAKSYPPQMQDLVVYMQVEDFLGSRTALMALDLLYGSGVWEKPGERERTSCQLLVFSDILPQG